MRLVRFSHITLTIAIAVITGCDPTRAHVSMDVGSRRLPHNELTHNALQYSALMLNADVRAALTQKPLNQLTLNGLSIYGSYANPLTQALMKYIIACALGEDQALVAADGMTMWNGELNLCQQWSNRLPDIDCQQVVSSCVLARVNAVEKKVVISMRGAGLPLHDRVPVETELRERTDVQSLSSNGCPDSTTSADAARNCRWAPLYVGSCRAGNVTATVAAPENAMLRVCKGLHGCDHLAANDTVPAYTGRLAEGTSAATFDCPANGYFAMMIANPDPTLEVDEALVDIPITFSGDVTYPANEEEVFMVREGAFYGNLFSSRDYANPPRPTQALSNNMYACSNETWSCGQAELTDRFCALDATRSASCSVSTLPTQCFANLPKPCHAPTESSVDSAQCLLSNPVTGVYQFCRGAFDDGYLFPITVYVNNACDLMREPCDPMLIVGKAQP